MIDTDWVKIGLEVVVLLGGTAIAVKVSIAQLQAEARANKDATKEAIEALKEAIDEIKTALRPVAELATRVALLDQRLAMAERRIEELAHGEGRILPLHRSPYEHGGGTRS